MATQTKPLACIILAAGQGSRMKSNMPKVMHKIAGRPMIEWLIETVGTFKPEKTVLVISPSMDDVQHSLSHLDIAFALQPEAKGTGDAVKYGLQQLGTFNGDVLILLGDMPLLSSYTLRRLIQDRKDGLSVLGVDLDPTPAFGRLITDKNGSLERIVEEKDANAEELKITLCNTGAFCGDAEQLRNWVEEIGNDNAQNEYYFTDVPAIAKAHGVSTYVCTTDNTIETMGVNTRADLSFLEFYVQDMLRQDALDSGATLLDRNSTFFSWDTKVGQDIIIEPNVFFGPGVTIGDNVHIKAYSHIEHTTIENHSSIGPFARLRGNNVIGPSSDIGNFVEVKKSTLGAGVKAKHLAYLGDAQIGDKTNIGCGVITVNYDGKNKHKTNIGHNVMVGSNVNLIAPVTLEDGSYIAAGSTITKNIEKDDLAVSRAETKVIKGWAARHRKDKK